MDNKRNVFKSFLPSLILIGLLTVVGLILYFFTNTDIFWPGFIFMIIFFGALFYIGSYAAKLKQEDKGSTNDILLAGRNIPFWMGVFTMIATWVGGGYINGTAGYTYNPNQGLVWIQAPWGYGLSLIIGGLFFAGTMRRHKFKTLLDPLHQRFGKRMSTLLYLPALTGELFWTAAILTALGATFATIMGIDIKTGIVISSFITITYTAIGGQWAVALTDVFQLILLAVGLIIVVPFAASNVGGWDHAWGHYEASRGGLEQLIPTKESLGDYYYKWWDTAMLLIFGGIPWQVYFQRVLSSDSVRTAKRMSIIAGFFCIIAVIPPIMIGVIGTNVSSWTALGADHAPENAALILPYVVRYLTPGFIAALGLGAVVAAVLSSVDASILSASSMTSWNIYRPIFQPNISSRKLSKVIKRCIWIIGITAVLLALNITSVYALWVLASDFVFVLIFPQLVTALFDTKANTWGSAAGFIVGLVLRLGGGGKLLHLPIWLPYPMIEHGEVLFPFRTFAMICSLITIIVVSRLTQRWNPPKKLRVIKD